MCAWCGTESVLPHLVFQLLCQSSFFEVNLNVIAWPNHYKRGFVRIFSYKAGAVQGYLLCSFTEELIEMNLPQQPKCSQRDWICPARSLSGRWQCHTVIPGGCSAFPLSSRGIPVFERVPDLASGTSGTSAAAQGHSTAAAPSVTCPVT